MSDSAPRLPARPSIEQLRKQAKERLVSLRSSDATATLADAHLALAREYGFASWPRLVHHVESVRAELRIDDEASERLGLSATPPFYRMDAERGWIQPRPPLSDTDWDRIVAVMKERHLNEIRSSAITDLALEKLTELDFVTSINADGAQGISDAGLQLLARMPQLEELDLTGSQSPITDRGLAVLAHLPNLRRFVMGWSPRVSDAGMANLAPCDRLQRVNLMGTRTGDGALAALRGKPMLTDLKTGRLVTDDGLAHLRDYPTFTSWDGEEPHFDLMSFAAESNNLMLDGPITDAGLRRLEGLTGLCGLGFFWHAKAFTGAGLAALAALPNLVMLRCQGDRCDDDAMRSIGALPRLRMLMAQGAVAGDDGFVALSRSRTLEYLWGRECPNLHGRGFASMAGMPRLRGLGVSCRKVDDASLASLPRFPALRQLMPMDVPDAGFRHVGACAGLVDLWCMYCRDTGDEATAHIAGLGLKRYYAGKTLITDHSLKILSRMASLEEIELWETAGITDAGLAALSALPNLRKVAISGVPHVTRRGAAVFAPGVRIELDA